ncbi:hypothetical protein TPHA_0A01240 [Tetrapisispora phaffii CBS 4417]|uniref:Metallo-beta-lactamase domain-containing protein n=1 Tax=Tetrapisispora phaffii (strain ATCC 24235 / CBS 4417 / NBRC 1672 / NRRL Y-8282 / UCD 70-5) TaxID=1071381 RepID=G8BMT0_TETPH|nr:hypothetical protein TPHA_0A01240 [Tetrapisispora phaffii CBS 4417]CCE61208.1 hypothetical protein TPHA_0A01240 [Tetrapisispora phaffii CBS 4417]
MPTLVMNRKVLSGRNLLLNANVFATKKPSLFIPNAGLRFQIVSKSTSRGYASKADTNKTKSLARRRVLNVLLTVLVPYTGYAFYVVTGASKEINLRAKELSTIEGEGELTNAGTLIKYSPLKILNRYENPFEEYRMQTVYEFFFNRVVEVFQRNRGGIPESKIEMDSLMPIHKPDWLPQTAASNHNHLSTENNISDISVVTSENILNQEGNGNTSEIYSTWLGQSCNFIYYNGLKIITDPLFSDYLIHEKYGPKRITSQPSHIDKVPQPDVIIVSHNHPDHLDTNSMSKWTSSEVLWIVPKGAKKFLQKHGVQNVIELCWWEAVEFKKNKEIYHISSVPAMHWSGRGLLDINESLWCSFIMTHNKQPILFHAGDTGYVSDLYKRIKLKFGGGCKLALLPCGQYCPEWHQRPRHINSHEVLSIMEDLAVKNVLGIHWGTFVLSGEYFREPKEKLELLAQWKGKSERCYCPELGKTIKFD